jgi:hypothetical protein
MVVIIKVGTVPLVEYQALCRVFFHIPQLQTSLAYRGTHCRSSPPRGLIAAEALASPRAILGPKKFCYYYSYYIIVCLISRFTIIPLIIKGLGIRLYFRYSLRKIVFN